MKLTNTELKEIIDAKIEERISIIEGYQEKIKIEPNLVIISHKFGNKRFYLDGSNLTNGVNVGMYDYYLIVQTKLTKNKGINYYEPEAFIEIKTHITTDFETVNNQYGNKKVIKQLAKHYDVKL